VEWFCETVTVMACTEHGNFAGILFHIDKRDLSCDFYARLGWTGTLEGARLVSHDIS
jgi:hypothetical protein